MIIKCGKLTTEYLSDKNDCNVFITSEEETFKIGSIKYHIHKGHIKPIWGFNTNKTIALGAEALSDLSALMRRFEQL